MRYNGANLVTYGGDKMEQLTKSEKIHLGTKEIAKRIRDQLKQEFKGCKFSVRTELYSGGSSIHVNLMESDFKVIRDFKDISERAIFQCESRRYTKEQIEQMQKKRYHQLGCHFYEDYDPDNWSNGVFLTEQGYNLFQRVQQIMNQYNYDNSDSMTDYFDVNFYGHINIGKWDENYKQIGGTKNE